VKKTAKMRAKKDMLKKLKSMMKEDMLGGFSDSEKKPMKITVMSDSKEGLEKGLSMAEKIMKKKKMMMEDMDDNDEECPVCGKEHEDEYGCGGKVK